MRSITLSSGIDQQYSQFKTELAPWLSEVPSVVLRNGAVLWKQAYSRYFSRLGGRPVIHKKHGKQSVWLTSEVFQFAPVVDADTGEITGHHLHIGTRKFPVGILDFKANKAYKIPASLHISIHAGHWYVSFNYDDGVHEPTDKDTTDWLMQFDETELRKMTVGLDRGVNLPLAGSDCQRFGFSDVQDKRLLKQERHKKRWQRRMAKRTKGSAGWVKAKRKVARYQRYGADVRRDVAHKTSHALAIDVRYKLYVFEALKVMNMTARPKPKQDNRISQAEFVCLSCGNTDHADHNAAKVIAMRGVRQLLSGKCVQKEKKLCRITRIKVGAEGSRTGCEKSQSTLGETVVSRLGGNTPALWSLTQETPTTTSQGF